MKEKTISFFKINVLGFVLSVIIICIPLLLYYINFKILIKEVLGNDYEIILFIITFLFSILIHELIHAFCFYIFTKNTKSIKIGFILSHLTPYTHCNQPLSKIQYMITLLMPGVILGIIPLIISFLLPDFLLLIYGIIMLTASLGDFIICFFLFQVPPHKKILDHDSKVGFWILD